VACRTGGRFAVRNSKGNGEGSSYNEGVQKIDAQRAMLRSRSRSEGFNLERGGSFQGRDCIPEGGVFSFSNIATGGGGNWGWNKKKGSCEGGGFGEENRREKGRSLLSMILEKTSGHNKSASVVSLLRAKGISGKGGSI